ncbi:iron-containing alcohol dehydrogenase [Lachnospiraceae bacterium OttesenSCG-928-J05]|nr:iron-containing alcohol dehydrogenase [Lachnospiraceae bacterium OttesenSCG-928-J05]
MENFNFNLPTEIVFGRGAEDSLAAQLGKRGAQKVLIVYGSKRIEESGFLDRVTSLLTEANIDCVFFGGVVANPRLGHAITGIEKGLELGVDFVLSIGGGSVIDTGKAIAIGIANERKDIWQYWLGIEVPERALRHGCILTIPAAGSEMSDSAVLTNEETKVKRGLSSELNRPAFAILNPELTLTLPKYQVANGAVDIFMHTVEGYFTPVSGDLNQMTDELAEGVMRNTVRNGRLAYEKPGDYLAMSELMWSGSLSHNGITRLGRPKDFAVHGLGHALSALYDTTHGSSLSAVWSSWARTVYKLDVPRFASYARKVWGVEEKEDEEAALKGIIETEQFFSSLDMPIRLTQLGMGAFSDGDLRKLAAKATFEDTRLLGSLEIINAQKAYEIYTKANEEI